MTRRSLRPSCGLIAWWMSALSRLPVLLLVFVHPVCTSESRRATDRWFTFRAERLHVSARFSAQMRLDCTEASPDTAPAPPIVLRFPHLSCKLKARTKVEDTAVACVHVSASVCVCVCVCVCGCALHVGGGRVKKKKKKEEVLSGTEAFCRCCGEGGVNGKFCGYQSRGALWLEEVCHMRPHPDSVSLLVWRGDHREVRGKWVTERWDEKIKGKVEGGKERKKRLKNMFTRGGWGWRRSLRFPSWRVSQSGGGWDSLLVPLDVTWGTLISVCLCLSPFLWPSRCLRSL